MGKLLNEFRNNLARTSLNELAHENYVAVEKVISLLEKGKIDDAGRLYFELFAYGIRQVKLEKGREAALLFLLLSEVPNISREVSSFAIDAMLFAEGDLDGEIKSLGDLETHFKKTKETVKHHGLLQAG